jgi:hypothetical protein
VGGILQISENPNDPNSDTDNLIEKYGQISLAEIRALKETYITQQIRPAQDNWMLYQCLMNSISKEGKAKITIWKNQYLVNGYCSGNLLLKIIIRESYLGTNATSDCKHQKETEQSGYLYPYDWQQYYEIQHSRIAAH